jgi:hypothetical protein
MRRPRKDRSESDVDVDVAEDVETVEDAKAEPATAQEPEPEVEMSLEDAKLMVEKAKARIAVAEKQAAAKIVDMACEFYKVTRGDLDPAYGHCKVLPNGCRLYIKVMGRDRTGKIRQIDTLNKLYRPSMEKRAEA